MRNYHPSNIVQRYNSTTALVVAAMLPALIAALVGSRAFFAGYLLASEFIFLAGRTMHRGRVIWLTGIIVVTSAILITAYYIKHDSSLGRLLIYKVSAGIWHNNWQSGVGLGQFRVKYLYEQQSYFRQGNYTVKDFLLADNTQFAFNDYWQFILETGLTGVMAIAGLLVSVIFFSRKILSANVHNRNVLLFALIQILAIALAGFFTHVFERFAVQLLLCLSCFTVFILIWPSQKKYLAGCGIGVIILLSAIKWGYYLTNYRNYQKLSYASELYDAGFITRSLTAYQQLYEPLKSDPLYLEQYAQVLITYGNYNLAELMLKQLLTKRCNNTHFSNLALCYYKQQKYKEAEEAYLVSAYMVPNRFRNRYDLFRFYINSRQFDKAAATGRDILTMPQKIPSGTIGQIKLKVSGQLKLITNQNGKFM